MAYLLDANAFIEARKRWYGRDFCPAYWEWLEAANESGLVYSIEKVADEIMAGEDDLVQWVKDRGDSFFLKPDQDVVRSLTTLSAWASSGDYDPAAVTTFLDVADSYLVAHAHAKGFTVVTHEKVANTPRIVKIPNACVAMDVKYRNTFEMLRNERARFVLPASA